MVNHNRGTRFLMNLTHRPRIYMCRSLGFLLVLLVLLMFSHCSQEEDKAGEIILGKDPGKRAQWADFFDEDMVIPFTFADRDTELYSLGNMQVGPHGDFFIYDGKVKRIYHFDQNGKLIRQIGRYGEGPGEYLLARCFFLDNHHDFFLCDLAKQRILKYRYPDYSYETEFKIDTTAQNIVVADDGNIILYTISDNSVLYKLDRSGNILKKSFTALTPNFRLFSARFQMGRIEKMEGGKFIFSYPEEYKIYVVDANLDIVTTFSAPEESRFFPGKAVFPATLSPYEYSPAHAKWWESELRIANVIYPGNGVFILQMCEIKGFSYTHYLNIHNLEGKTFVAGLALPFDGIVRYAKEGYIYVLENSKIDERGEVDPLKLHRFKLKQKLLAE